MGERCLKVTVDPAKKNAEKKYTPRLPKSVGLRAVVTQAREKRKDLECERRTGWLKVASRSSGPSFANNETLGSGVTLRFVHGSPRTARGGEQPNGGNGIVAECALREGKDDEGEPTRGEEDRTTEGRRERERKAGER